MDSWNWNACCNWVGKLAKYLLRKFAFLCGNHSGDKYFFSYLPSYTCRAINEPHRSATCDSTHPNRWQTSSKQSVWTAVCIYVFTFVRGAWGGVVVKALHYQSDGPGIDSRWCHWIFQWHNPSDRTMALGAAQPLLKMSTRNISWG